MVHNSVRWIGSALCLGFITTLVGCAHPTVEGPGGSPPTVTASEPLQREITDYAEYTGRTAAVDSVQARARVSGYLQKINFKDGTEVKEGTVLYEIDPRPYKDALAQAAAQVRLQTAQLTYQEATYQRNLKLYQTSQAIAQEDLQQTLAQRDATSRFAGRGQGESRASGAESRLDEGRSTHQRLAQPNARHTRQSGLRRSDRADHACFPGSHVRLLRRG